VKMLEAQGLSAALIDPRFAKPIDSQCVSTYARRRRCERGFFDTGFLPGGHQTGQIFGVGEEGEDDLNRVG